MAAEFPWGIPIGATGARMLVTAMYEMKREKRKNALITMCIGGGQGMAMVVRKVKRLIS